MASLVRRVLALALAGGILFDILVPGNAAGLNAPLVMAAFLGAALLAAGRAGLARMDPADGWLAPAALVLATLAVVRADDWLVTLDLLFAAALAAAAVACLAGGRVTRGAVPRVLELAVGAIVAAGVGVIGVVGAGRGSRAPDAGRGALDGADPHGWRARLGRATPVARGLVIALPILAVFAALFASADAVFARLASDMLAWQPDVDLEELVGRALVITIVAWGGAGLLGLGAGLLPAFTARAPGAPPPVGPATPGSPLPPPAPAAATWPPMPAWGPETIAPAVDRPPLRLGSTECATILLVVDALFVAFVALQLAWLFGGRDTLAMTGFTYAEYARRGFFDLVIVAALAGTLVVTLDLAAARRTRIGIAAAIGLLVLTGVILVSAFLRLRLYQDAYGWTELRFVVLAGILSLGVALAATAALLWTGRTRWVLHALGILVLVALAGMNAVGPQAFVAQRNLERAIDPSLVPEGGRTGLDAGYLWQLGDEAVIPVTAAWDRLPEADRGDLAEALRSRAAALADDPTLQGWPAWNLTRARARDALRAWEAGQGTASR